MAWRIEGMRQDCEDERKTKGQHNVQRQEVDSQGRTIEFWMRKVPNVVQAAMIEPEYQSEL